MKQTYEITRAATGLVVVLFGYYCIVYPWWRFTPDNHDRFRYRGPCDQGSRDLHLGIIGFCWGRAHK